MSRKPFKHNPRLLAVAVAACFAAAPAWSLPTAPTVVNGTASFNQAGNVLSVTNSNNAIINWQKFGISAGEVTKFIQASASSAVLNRVVGGDLSAIYGSLQSNGRVWLVNPAGILVGQGATIDTAAFVASTLAMRDADFLAGKLTFSGPGANVINQGSITTPTGGSVYLIGANVSNEGIINTPKGEVILAAGQTVNLVDTATPGLKVEVTGAAGNTTNLGTIAAEAGRIGMAGVIVRNSGTLNASSAVQEGGRVFLKASQDTFVDGNGRIVATGTKGGRVEVLGNRVAVMGSASIDASGANGGGTVLVGGDLQGGNPDIQNSQVTYFGPNVSIKANATDNGDGGKVIVWADDTTRAYGRISARGGDNGGNGGFVETSGKRALDISGARVDTRAPRGKTGNWLLDPVDVEIVSGGYNPDDGVPSYSGAYGSYFAPAEGILFSITDGDVNTALLTTALTIQTDGFGSGSGNITVSGASIYSEFNALTLLAYGDGGTTVTGNVKIENSSIMTSGLTVVAGWSGSPGLDTTVPATDGNIGRLEIIHSTLDATSGSGGNSVLLKAAGNVTVDSTSTVLAGPLTLMAGRHVEINGTLSGGTNVVVTAGLEYFGDGSMANGLGGDITIGQDAWIAANSGYLVLQAERGTTSGAGGNITQYGGGAGFIGGYFGVSIAAAGNAKIGGSVGSYGHVQIAAGVSGGYYGRYDFSPNPYGGNVELDAGSRVIGYSYNSNVLISAERGTASGANGNITQYGGGRIEAGADGGEGNVLIAAAGNVSLYGSVIANTQSGYTTGNVIITAGLSYFGDGSTANDHGGNITLGASSVIDAGGYVVLQADRSAVTGANGNITQYGGYIWGYSGVSIVAGGDATIGGYAGSSNGAIQIIAGMSGGYYGYADFSANPYGGDILLRGSSHLEALAGDVIVKAAGGTSRPGSITQDAGGSIVSNGGYDVEVTGQGAVSLSGTVSGYDVSIHAGFGTSTPQNAAIGIINAGLVFVQATGAIVDQNAPGVTNITAPTVRLESHYGGSPGSLAISMDVMADTSVQAIVYGGSGGIRISNTSAAQPGIVSLDDHYASANNSVSFTQNFTGGGTLTTSSLAVQTAAGGSIDLASNDGLTFNGGINPAVARVSLAATGPLNINSALIAGGNDVNFNAGAVNINADVSGLGVGLTGGTVTIASGATVFGTDNVGVVAGVLEHYGTLRAGHDITISAGPVSIVGGMVDAGNSVSLGATALTMSSGTIQAENSVGLLLPGSANLVNSNITADYGNIDIDMGGSLDLTNSFIGAGIWIETPYSGAGGDMKLATSRLTMTDSGLFAWNQLALKANYVTMDRSSIDTWYGDIKGRITHDLNLTGSIISAGKDIYLQFVMPDSSIYLNGSASHPAEIESNWYTGTGQTTYIDFLSRTSGGVWIDGTETADTVDGGSGFYHWVGGSRLVALQNDGLYITYAQSQGDICTTMPDLCRPPVTATSLVDVCAFDPKLCTPPTAGGGGQTTELGDQGIGGGEGEFGDDGKGGKEGRRRVRMCRG